MRIHSVACGLLGMVLTGPGLAQQNASAPGVYRFSIPAEPLGDALSDLAQQTGLQVMISSKLVAGVQSRGLKGTYSADEALDALLANTGLQYTFVNPRTVAINASLKPAPPRSETSKPVTGEPATKDPDSVLSSTDGEKKMQNRSFLARVLSLFALCGSATHGGTACAQETGATGSGGLEEVVVTAQKRTERLLDVPMSISALSGDDLAGAGISSTGDLQQVAPGVISASVGLAFTPTIRGVTSTGTSPGDETNVSIYLDDVYIGAPIAGLFEFRDIERIEVLKGPQGTLFGRNATGGAIRIVTRAPSFDPKGEVAVDYGFEDSRIKLASYFTGGLSESVAASFNVSYSDDDGFVKGIAQNSGRRYGASQNFTARGKLLYRASEDFKVTVSADYSERDDDTLFLLTPRGRRNALETVPGVVIPGLYEYSGSTQPIIKVDGGGAGVDIEWSPSDDIMVRSITAYRDANGLYLSDSDRTNLGRGANRLKQDQSNFSQEFNVSGPSDATWSWLAGLYYYDADAGNPVFNAHATDAPNGPIASGFTSNVQTTSWAGFGDLTWNATDRLHLTLGGRYTSEKKDFEYRGLSGSATGVRAADDHTWTSPTFRTVARYDFAEDANVYVSASNGFKSGVYNGYGSTGVPIDPEKIMAYEIGAKARIHDITLTAAAFKYDYKDIQVQSATLVGATWVVSLTNAARAKIEGFEVAADAQLSDKFNLNVGLSALPTARYSEFTRAQVFTPNPATGGNNIVVPYDATGSRVVRSPKYQANARLSYTDQLFAGELNASVNYSYNDGFNWQPGNFSPEDSYAIVNARIAWTAPSNRYTFSIWGENLSDEIYSTYTSSTATTIADVYARPRLIGVGAVVRFGQ